MKIEFKNITIDGYYQWFWLNLFDLLIWLNIDIYIGDNVHINNFNIDASGWNPKSGRYLFALMVREMQEGKKVEKVDQEGVTYVNELKKAHEKETNIQQGQA